jgi:hypothetical protein
VYQLETGCIPKYVALINMKISPNTRTECVLIKLGGPQDSFIWRSPISPSKLTAAWNQIPAPGEEAILWMSLPPLGDKAKRRGGYLLGGWQTSKR